MPPLGWHVNRANWIQQEKVTTILSNDYIQTLMG